MPSTEASRPKQATRCPRCGQAFAADGRFCPFDAAPLLRGEDWTPSEDPLLGTVIERRYEVEALIGQGGVGSVYRARDRALGRSLAIKVLRRELSDDPELRVACAVYAAHPALPDQRLELVAPIDHGAEQRIVAGGPVFRPQQGRRIERTEAPVGRKGLAAAGAARRRLRP